MDQDLIKKFIEGGCNPEEVRAVLKWYQSEDADIQFSKEIENLIKKYEDGKIIQDFNQEKVFNKIYEKVKQNLNSPVSINKYRKGNLRKRATSSRGHFENFKNTYQSRPEKF